jgi:phage pi2 protein 07
LLILIVALHNVSSARILVLHPSPSQSHLIVTKALTKELACRGHEVTMFSQFPLEKPLQNYRDIKVEINDTFSAIIKGLVSQSGSIWSWLKVFPKLVASLTETGEAILQHPELQRMMREEKFDLVIVGYFATNFLLGVADHFKCPQIMISPAGVFTSINMVCMQDLQ